MPYYAQTLAATPTVVSLLLDANAATQLVGAPIIGRLSDRCGLAFTVFQTVFLPFAQKRLLLVAIQGDGIGLLDYLKILLTKRDICGIVNSVAQSNIIAPAQTN